MPDPFPYDFRLAVPRAGRALPWSSEIEGVLFSNSASDLEHLLIVPVQPESTPFYTVTDPETWPQYGAAAAAAAAAVDSAAAVASDAAAAADAAADTVTSTVRITGKTPVTFRSLPLDIHLLVLDHLEDPPDLTCLALAAPYLWDTIQRIVPRRYASKIGLWAGEQLVCAGVDLPNDFPPGMYSARELQRINGHQNFNLDGVAVTANNTVVANGAAIITELTIPVYKANINAEIPQLLTLHNLCQLPNVRFEEDPTLYDKSLRVFSECIRRCDSASQISLVQKACREIVTKRSPFIPRNQAWILRNLTTKEFVTAEGIALDKKFIDGPFIKGIGFGEAVLAFVCWSSYHRTDFSYSLYVNRGPWAGHRFEITTRRRHDESTKGEEGEWMDVSKVVADEIAAIWYIQYGSGWRNVASNIAAV